MAELLQTYADGEMDRMPSVRADSNFVRLMNLHKAKGLQGKIVVFLPGKPSDRPPESHVERDGAVSLGWFVLREGDGFNAISYAPPEWEERRQEETLFQKAEKIRLKYVALTRAEDEAHVFTLRVASDGGKAQLHRAWAGFEAAGAAADAIGVLEAGETPADGGGEREARARAVQRELEGRLPAVMAARVKRVAPSGLDALKLKQEHVKVEEQLERGYVATVQSRPGGTAWGAAVHRAAELIVSGGVFTADAIEAAAEQAVCEQFKSELLGERERAALLLKDEMQSLEQIQAYLVGEMCGCLAFMADETSGFRRMLEGAARYPEMPFAVSIGADDKALFERLVPLVRTSGERRLDVSGKIDLALRYPDGTWRILDYKTDRMLPCDHDDIHAFRDRLNLEYGNQLAIYRAILERLTGEPVVEAKLLAI